MLIGGSGAGMPDFFRAQFKKNWVRLKISENSKKHRKLARFAEPVDGETVDGTFRLDTR